MGTLAPFFVFFNVSAYTEPDLMLDPAFSVGLAGGVGLGYDPKKQQQQGKAERGRSRADPSAL